MTFTLSSPARAATKDREGKPETIVEVETDGIRERGEYETVHLTIPFSDGQVGRCTRCYYALGPNEPWTDNAELHSRHPARCSS